MSKAFWLLNTETSQIDTTLQSNTPREAALKAASRHKTNICLVEASAGKVHLFQGSRVPLDEREMSEFTAKNNITAKPHVTKVGYKKIAANFNEADLQELSAVIREEFGFSQAQ